MVLICACGFHLEVYNISTRYFIIIKKFHANVFCVLAKFAVAMFYFACIRVFSARTLYIEVHANDDDLWLHSLNVISSLIALRFLI